jgi:hypothetical protein
MKSQNGEECYQNCITVCKKNSETFQGYLKVDNTDPRTADVSTSIHIQTSEPEASMSNISVNPNKIARN